MSDDAQVGGMVALFFILLFGGVFLCMQLDGERIMRCIAANTARPAIEVKLLCGSLK